MNKAREHWGSTFGFIMAAAGSAIGLGTLWQFPYMVGHNGGGLFVLLFLFFTVILGVPLFIAEVLIGRKAEKAAVGIFRVLSNDSPKWNMLGWLSVLSAFLILSYYMVVSGWGLNYIFLSISQFNLGKSPQEISDVFNILFKSSQINVFWCFIFILINIAVVYQGVRKGIEHWAKLLTTALLIILLLLLFYSFTLDGFSEAFKFVFYPTLHKLKPSAVLEALGLAFFTLSLGQGVMLTYGSYIKKTEDIPKTACIIGLMNVIVSIFAALVIFPVIFTFGFQPEEGFGLIFRILPVLFAKLPGSLIISTIFFILLVFTALTSSVALMEVIVANLMEIFSWTRKKSTLVSAAAIFIAAIPCALSGSGALFPDWVTMYGKNYFETIVDLLFQWMIPICGFFISIFVGWYLKKEMVKEEFKLGSTWGGLFSLWLFFIRWIAPLAIFVIILQRTGVINLDLIMK